MSTVGSHRRQVDGRSVPIDDHYRIPRRRPDEDGRIHKLEVRKGQLMRQLKASEERASDYTRYGLTSAADRMKELVADLKSQIAQTDNEIVQLRQQADKEVLEGVQD